MTKSWKQTANPDVLQHMSILTKQIEDLTDKLDNNKTNYNNLQRKLAEASKDIQRLNDTNSELLCVVTVRNRAIKRKDDQLRRKDNTIYDLRSNKS